ncbi:MAG TPA: SDR family oxidoreductase [Myxococcota bacterium]
MSKYDDVTAALQREPKTWLVTGAAGFIGSHLVQTLLRLNQRVVGVDNFATGHRKNLDEAAGSDERFTFHEGDVSDVAFMDGVMPGIDIVLHQAALGSVPRSIKDPLTSHKANVDGFVVMLDAARRAGVKRVVYASSSSVYGDEPNLPKQEHRIGKPLSPYAATKAINEVYADVFGKTYGLQTIGLRYFNVFGPRQDKAGAYAAVIPAWVGRLLGGEACTINGDGDTSRDFCFVDNAVQANILAGVADDVATQQVYNVACGDRTTLTTLFALIRDGLADRARSSDEARRLRDTHAAYGAFRDGDVRHSLADITRARQLLGYEPTHDVKAGLDTALSWYAAHV